MERCFYCNAPTADVRYNEDYNIMHACAGCEESIIEDTDENRRLVNNQNELADMELHRLADDGCVHV